MASPIKGRATIRTAAVLLLASIFYDRFGFPQYSLCVGPGTQVAV
jgi:hypothetical protein